MKVSVSLPTDDIEFLDAYSRERRAASRSAALHQAVVLLRAAQLQSDYEQAFADWESSGEADAWDAVSDDGLVEQ